VVVKRCFRKVQTEDVGLNVILQNPIVALFLKLGHIKQKKKQLKLGTGGLTMADFEYVLICFLVPVFGVMCYLAGKGDLLTLIPEIFRKKLEELTNHGEWIVMGDGKYTPFMCTHCGKTTSWYHKQTAKYCPNCGAKMDLKE